MMSHQLSRRLKEHREHLAEVIQKLYDEAKTEYPDLPSTVIDDAMEAYDEGLEEFEKGPNPERDEEAFKEWHGMTPAEQRDEKDAYARKQMKSILRDFQEDPESFV